MKRLLVLGAIVAASGCYDAYSNFNIVYLKSLPRELRVEVPNDGNTTTTQALRTAQDEDTPAKFHRDSVRGADEVNETVFGIFEFVDQIVDAVEPVAENENTRFWGPIPIDDAQELALIINRTVTSTSIVFIEGRDPVEANEFFDYALLLRPMGGGDDDWRPIFGGRSVVIEGTPVGAGALYLDVGIVSDGDAPGIMFLLYDSRDGQTSVSVGWDVDRVTPKFEAETVWFYQRYADGSGSFFLISSQDLGEQNGNPETLLIFSRWRSVKDGRADVIVKDGDLGQATFRANECWSTSFNRTFFDSNFPEFAPLITGTPQDCPEGLRESNFRQ